MRVTPPVPVPSLAAFVLLSLVVRVMPAVLSLVAQGALEVLAALS
jgi:hypothetical protein